MRDYKSAAEATSLLSSVASLINLPFKLCFIKMHILFGISTFRCLMKHSKRVKQKTFPPPTEKIVKQNRTLSTFTCKVTLNI